MHLLQSMGYAVPYSNTRLLFASSHVGVEYHIAEGQL